MGWSVTPMVLVLDNIQECETFPSYLSFPPYLSFLSYLSRSPLYLSKIFLDALNFEVEVPPPKNSLTPMGSERKETKVRHAASFVGYQQPRGLRRFRSKLT